MRSDGEWSPNLTFGNFQLSAEKGGFMASSGIVDNIFRKKAKDRYLGEKLNSDLPERVKGKPQEIRQKNFTIPLEQRIRSYLDAPEFALRARKIEDAIEELMEALALEYADMIKVLQKNPEIFAQKWTVIDSLELNELNGLIEKHNRYYPMEANLNMDVSGHYLLGSKIWKGKEKITKDALLKQFPLL